MQTPTAYGFTGNSARSSRAGLVMEVLSNDASRPVSARMRAEQHASFGPMCATALTDAAMQHLI
jgi:hypothetical protein